ncbi:Thiamine biosynthesis lipoprotein ApbE precursor [Thalassoglobus neptunius]|uniref:FAD:protein FMN transferase n=1 Tax=Thalassoglobus neptunius TaxID=1938619 RepID=A0A5C5X4L6_9PLAN|nr:FAD:protein FMN transferase [Thalassoglobus neptunius]TWT57924.1 Thiamine biosynthesis lipoprotein ApbE precursor [Thalassoglobus neptunius]
MTSRVSGFAVRLAAFVHFLMIALVPQTGHAEVVEIVGETMGTTYSIKWVVESALQTDGPDLELIREQVDHRLNEILAMMSTYDPESELSRFNAQTSTDWFPVSAETAEVVEAALEIFRVSGGAFDPTVGRLVRMWRFGKDPAADGIPSDEEIQAAMESVGGEHISVRMNPPAIKKSLPDVELDLSAIAKGYGVDAIVALLNEQQIENCLVEIGGEVRTSGRKEGQPWRLGVERPNSDSRQLQATVALENQALATSGNYRNYFEYDGKRYSHTIDPRTGSPVTHDLSSVSVIADNCMFADAWATTLMVLGPEEGMRLADQEGIAAYLITDDENGIEKLATTASEGAFVEVDPDDLKGDGQESPLTVFLVTILVFALALSGLAVGVIFSNRALKGSCGGAEGLKDEEGRSICEMCTTPPEECDQFKQQLKEQVASSSKSHSESGPDESL